MRVLALVRWELVQTMRGSAPFAAISFVSLVSAALVGAGIVGLSLWSPFALTTPSFPGRIDPNASPGLIPIIGEFRGGVAFLILVVWLLFLAAAIAPALLAGVIVRDRRAGRLDLVLTDASRADVVAIAKLVAALVPLGLILLCAGPAISFAWLVGGMAGADAFASIAILLVTVVLIATIGLVCSAVATTEVAAILASYFFVAVFLIGPLIVGVGLTIAGYSATARVVLALDPFVSVLSAQSELATKLYHVLPIDWPTPEQTLTIGKATLHAWVANIVVYLVAAFALVGVTSIVLEPLHPIKSWRLRHLLLPR